MKICKKKLLWTQDTLLRVTYEAKERTISKIENWRCKKSRRSVIKITLRRVKWLIYLKDFGKSLSLKQIFVVDVDHVKLFLEIQLPVRELSL